MGSTYIIFTLDYVSIERHKIVGLCFFLSRSVRNCFLSVSCRPSSKSSIEFNRGRTHSFIVAINTLCYKTMKLNKCFDIMLHCCVCLCNFFVCFCFLGVNNIWLSITVQCLYVIVQYILLRMYYSFNINHINNTMQHRF